MVVVAEFSVMYNHRGRFLMAAVDIQTKYRLTYFCLELVVKVEASLIAMV